MNMQISDFERKSIFKWPWAVV